MKKPQSLNTLAIDARIQGDAEYGFAISVRTDDELTVKQAERLATWLLSACNWIDSQPKMRVRK